MARKVAGPQLDVRLALIVRRAKVGMRSKRAQERFATLNKPRTIIRNLAIAIIAEDYLAGIVLQ